MMSLSRLTSLSSYFRPKPPSLEIGKELSRGAYGAVYSGRLDGKQVAIKRIHGLLFKAARELGDLDKMLGDFRRECKLHERVDHPHVVKFEGAFYDETTDEPVLVMELMTENLRQYLDRNRSQLSRQKQLEICISIVRGLRFLHTRTPPIVHRDLTDKNVLLDADGVAKISDLGQARLKTAEYFSTGQPGAVPFMSPEAMRESPHYSEKLDIFSLGVLMLEIATQQFPRVGLVGIGVTPELQRRRQDLSKLDDDHPLRPLILSCLKDNPKERPDIVTVFTQLVARAEGVSMCRMLQFTEKDCAHLYEKAIHESPTINLHVAKAMTIGPPRVGKTFLRHLLLELQLPDVIASTPVMKAAETVSITSLDEQPPVQSDIIHLGACGSKKMLWSVVNEASAIQSLLNYLQQLVESAATRREKAARKSGKAVITDVVPLPQHQSEEAAEVTDAGTVDIVPGCQEEKVKQHPSDVAAFASRIYQLLQSPDIANVELPDCKLLQFLDCGGQLAYHDILPVFTTSPAVYLHVFNLNEDLNSHPVDQICFSEDGGEVYGSAKSPLTVAQMLVRSIITVNSLIDVERQLPKDVLQSEPPEPRVVLVGTHLDKLEERCKGAIKRELESVKTVLNIALDSTSLCLKEMLVRNQHPALPPMFFPTGKLSSEQVEEKESSQITRHSVMELKQKIEKLVSAVRVKVPVKWYLHQMLDISRSKEERKPVHRYRDLYQSCLREQAVGDVGEFHAMVTYFHALGLLIHLCGEDVPHGEESVCLVFTDPSYLFENITKLYQVQFMEEDRCEGSLLALRCQGRLTKKALRALNVDSACLSNDVFMELLVQLFIGADITERVGGKEGRVLFVPSVIPAIDAAIRPGMITDHSCPYFVITFESKLFIPCGVFTGAIARLQSNPTWNLLYKCTSRLHAKFRIGTHDTVYIIDNSTHIKVAVDVDDQRNKEQCRDIIIHAVAQSYCFLFHGKKSLQCGICQEKPFLVLGLLCRCPSCKANAAAKIAELCAKDRIPKTVRCLDTGHTENLSDDQLSLFWNIKHNAVVIDQHTKPLVADEHPSQTVSQISSSPTPEQAVASPKTVAVNCTGEQVLDNFRTRFIDEMDAMSVVLTLKDKGIISDGVLQEVKTASGRMNQNASLHARLKESCTKVSLMTTCRIIIAVQGNPRMKAFGEDMLRELEECSSAPGVREPHTSTPESSLHSGHSAHRLAAAVISARDIMRELGDQVDASWKKFGLQLDVDYDVLDDIKTDNSGTPGDCMLDLVARWTSRKPGTGDLPRTWETVVQALRDAGQRQLADRLGKKYQVEFQVQNT